MPITLGPDWQRDLWASPLRLRFELNTGGNFVTMFTGSYDRARTLARAALPVDQVIAIVAALPNPDKEVRAKQRGWTKRSAFEILNEMGVPTEPALDSWFGHWWPGAEADDEATLWLHRAVRLNWEQADILLWNQFAHDMGVIPQAPALSMLLDVERGISVNAYDDRGMDITALNEAPLLDLYRRFDTWLLDYDRPRMASMFER